jgi:hypothetical protein
VYRTGKSYLLNALMGASKVGAGAAAPAPSSASSSPAASQPPPPPSSSAAAAPGLGGVGGGGFSVGSTVKACTKGIWVWGRALEVEGSDTHVLFLDTEGLGSTVRSETYDTRVFALALLLSSYFIYNSFGTVDGAAIAKLSLVVNLTRHIHVRSAAGREDSGTEFGQFFPAFLWVVRDFSVKLERDGRKISAREYLEDALRPEDGVSEAVEQKNAVRMLIRNFFPERDCEGERCRIARRPAACVARRARAAPEDARATLPPHLPRPQA